MQDILTTLTLADYQFVVGVVTAPVTFSDSRQLKTCLAAVEVEDTLESRKVLCQRLEHEIRYLGSADAAYFFRKMLGQAPGVSFSQIIRDTARMLKVRIYTLATEREMLAELAQVYATEQFARLSAEEQQQMLEDLGVERERAAAFLKKSAGVFAAPILIEAFGIIVVQGLIKTILFGIITKIVGKQLATRLFSFLFSRLPWWAGWVSPVAWTLSVGWTTLDIQGPATRKTIPIVLYLGLCCLREQE